MKTRVRLVAVAAAFMTVVPMAGPASACSGKLYEQCQEIMIELQNFMCYTFRKCL